MKNLLLLLLFFLVLPLCVLADEEVVVCSGKTHLGRSLSLKIYEQSHPLYFGVLEKETPTRVKKIELKNLKYLGGLHQFYYSNDSVSFHMDDFAGIDDPDNKVLYNAEIRGIDPLFQALYCCANVSALFPLGDCKTKQ